MGDWLTNWPYRKTHIIVGPPSGAQINYQIPIVIHYSGGTDSDRDVYLNKKCSIDFKDIRFCSGSTDITYDYYIYSSASAIASCWVEIPNIPDSDATSTISIYYGNDGAVNSSNGALTFPLGFQDFDKSFGNNTLNAIWKDVGATAGTWQTSKTTAISLPSSLRQFSALTTGDFVGLLVSSNVNGVLTKLDKNTNKNYYYEAWYKRESATTSDYFGPTFNWQSWGHFMMGNFASNTQFKTYTHTSSYANISTFTFANASNTWYKIGVGCYQGKNYYYINNVFLGGDFVSNYASGSCGNRGDRFNNDFWEDTLIIRNYVLPEPTHGIWNIEETPPQPPTGPTWSSFRTFVGSNILWTLNSGQYANTSGMGWISSKPSGAFKWGAIQNSSNVFYRIGSLTSWRMLSGSSTLTD